MLALLMVASVSSASPQASQKSAADLLKAAQVKAAKEGKVVFVSFHASWCGWCKRLDAFISNPVAKPILEKGFVFVSLDVLENKGKENLETPGGLEVLKSVKGEEEGLPFSVIYSAKGVPLIDSRKTPGKAGSNIGYPAAPDEIAHFLKMLETAPKITPADRATLKDWLVKNAPKN